VSSAGDAAPVPSGAELPAAVGDTLDAARQAASQATASGAGPQESIMGELVRKARGAAQARLGEGGGRGDLGEAGGDLAGGLAGDLGRAAGAASQALGDAVGGAQAALGGLQLRAGVPALEWPGGALPAGDAGRVLESLGGALERSAGRVDGGAAAGALLDWAGGLAAGVAGAFAPLSLSGDGFAGSSSWLFYAAYGFLAVLLLTQAPKQ